MKMDRNQDTHHEFTDICAVVLGLAREGTALTRFLVERGVRVTVTDIRQPDALAESLAALADLPVTYALGEHPVSVLDGADIVFVSPGVPLEIPFLAEARQRNLPLSSETRLFTRLCPARIVGITGSSGKSTTTALVGAMLQSVGFQTWVGGNIGRPLIGHLEQIRPSDIVVMELSSFQLELFAPWSPTAPGQRRARQVGSLYDPSGWSPPIAAVLNVTPNHLDRHPTVEAYVAAKTHILAYQQPGDLAVLNLDNPVTHAMGKQAALNARHVLWFSLEREVEEGAFLRDGRLILRFVGHEQVLIPVGELRLLGRHNLANSLAASALAVAALAACRPGLGGGDLPVEALRRALASFRGVEHRLELVRERAGVRWYNDSIATSPERTLAALESFESPIVLLAGGRDKNLAWDDMAALTWRKVRHLILFGEAADLIDRAMHQAELAAGNVPPATRIYHAGTLDRAVDLAARLAQPGDVVLLSPGGTSFDAYRDFVARGEHFRKLVRALE